MLITRHADAAAVLADPRYVPPPAAQDAPEGTMAWLRARVSRFSTGATHAERRRDLLALLDGIDPAGLRADARDQTRRRGGDWRGVPTAVLGAALGVEDTSPIADAAAGYLSGPGDPDGSIADAAVAKLLATAGIPAITLLLQAHAATETLIEHALRHRAPGQAVDALLHETLRHDPPLTVTRRVDTLTGDEVTIDLVSANRDPSVFPDPDRFDPHRFDRHHRHSPHPEDSPHSGDCPHPEDSPHGGGSSHLTFGYGVRPCPGPAHALALAAGVLEGLVP
ncbi:cytochrome P450 [Nonomuraea sp. NPDC049419]|uniref:cytochrome P450 n=1 Tax=Nonomuraea sp. NPDC049419 TaxID=3155772 RepID=UPI003446CDFC